MDLGQLGQLSQLSQADLLSLYKQVDAAIRQREREEFDRSKDRAE